MKADFMLYNVTNSFMVAYNTVIITRGSVTPPMLFTEMVKTQIYGINQTKIRRTVVLLMKTKNVSFLQNYMG